MSNDLSQCGIYKILNSSTGKVYVGSAVNIRKRWTEHKRTLRIGLHCNILLQRAWTKHGDADFTFSILEGVDERRNLVSREQYWLDLLAASDPAKGYNLCSVAGSQLGAKRTPEQREKMSLARMGVNRGIPLSSEHRAKIAESLRGIKPSAEARLLMSVSASARKRRKCSEETKMKIGAKNAGRIPSKETRKKMSDSAKIRAARVSKQKLENLYV